MQFCAQHSKDLDSAFAALSLQEESPKVIRSAVDLPSRTIRLGETRPLTPSPPKHHHLGRNAQTVTVPPASSELSIVLTALRKLREGLLASSASAVSPLFAQRVHVFNIRLAILAQHPESYHPSLLHLLSMLHTKAHPLPRSELVEMTTYMILDLATRQENLGGALALRHNSKVKYGYDSRMVDALLRSIVMNDWVSFWSTRRKVDGYVRAMLHWHAERLRKTVLKAIGRTYMMCDIKWILKCATDGEMSWDELLVAEDVGWIRDGDKAIIRKPKGKGS